MGRRKRYRYSFYQKESPRMLYFHFKYQERISKDALSILFLSQKRPSLNNWPLFLIKSRSAVLVYSHSDWYIKTKKIILRC